MARVLVVDDAVVDRKVAAHALSKAGYQPTVCGDAKAALELLATSPFDLVLLDINLPGLDGFALLQSIKKQSSLRSIPVVMMSSDGADKRFIR